jgi:hypothetical protein
LKSPVSWIDDWPATLATNGLFAFNMLVPFISQIATLPDVSCHKRSPKPSPLKSGVPTMLQLVGTVKTNELFWFNKPSQLKSCVSVSLLAAGTAHGEVAMVGAVLLSEKTSAGSVLDRGLPEAGWR